MKQIVAIALILTSFQLAAQTIKDFIRLQEAAETGDPAIVKAVIDSGININIQLPKLGDTVLHRVVQKGNLDAVNALIENGAQINARNFQTISKSPYTDDQGRTPLHIAGAQHKLNIVYYLVKHGADPHATDSHKHTPFTLAEKNESIPDRLAVMYYLINKMDE